MSADGGQGGEVGAQGGNLGVDQRQCIKQAFLDGGDLFAMVGIQLRQRLAFRGDAGFPGSDIGLGGGDHLFRLLDGGRQGQQGVVGAGGLDCPVGVCLGGLLRRFGVTHRCQALLHRLLGGVLAVVVVKFRAPGCFGRRRLGLCCMGVLEQEALPGNVSARTGHGVNQVGAGFQARQVLGQLLPFADDAGQRGVVGAYLQSQGQRRLVVGAGRLHRLVGGCDGGGEFGGDQFRLLHFGGPAMNGARLADLLLRTGNVLVQGGDVGIQAGSGGVPSNSCRTLVRFGAGLLRVRPGGRGGNPAPQVAPSDFDFRVAAGLGLHVGQFPSGGGRCCAGVVARLGCHRQGLGSCIQIGAGLRETGFQFASAGQVAAQAVGAHAQAGANRLGFVAQGAQVVQAQQFGQ